MALVVVLAGGGTGGHVFPALALADTIAEREPQAHVRFVGTQRGIEARVVPAAGYPLDVVPALPVVGKRWLEQLCGLGAALRGTLAALRILRREQADLVIGVGGYVSVPTVAAALLLGIPTALLNVDAKPGRANRLLGRFARAVFTQFEESARWFPRGRCQRTGMPVRSVCRARPGEDPGVVRILVFGGSQGARALNRAVVSGLDQLGERDGFRITHQTGAADLEEVQRAYTAAGVKAEIAPFFAALPERYARVDLVVSRACASTIAELCLAGLPSILVPLTLANDHQMANARALEAAGAAVVVPEPEARERLPMEIRRLGSDPELRAQKGQAAARRAVPDAAERIWGACAAWLPSATGGVA